MVGMIKEGYKENGDRVITPAVEDRCKKIGTIATPSTTIILKAVLIFRELLLLLYKFSGGGV